jgi:WbqC-like protein family
MTLAIMQPYIFPYIGYFQLLANVDQFVIYDNIQYTKKGWINRNRILQNGSDFQFTIPLKKDSDFLDIGQRTLSDSWEVDKSKLLNKVKELYRKAPYYSDAFPIMEECFNCKETNLFSFLYHSLQTVNNYLAIKTPIILSSTLAINHSTKGENKVIEICKYLNATNYINAIGGQELYSKEIFFKNGITLQFIKTNTVSYKQFDNEFVPYLSIIDLMMFNSTDQIKYILNNNYSIL